MLEIYVDGSSTGAVGAGGYGVVTMLDGEVISTYSNHYEETTNNAMEMKAILYAMVHFGKKFPAVTVYSDSAYAINTFTKWMFGWAAKDWTKGDGNPPENLDIIQAYYNLYNEGYRINLVKVKGHSGNPGNELADKLAKSGKFDK